MDDLLRPDIKWEKIYGIKTFDEFINKFVPRIYLKPVVANDIKNIFRVIQKLLDFSYFEYEFADEAALKAKLALETFLKVRYREIAGEIWPRKKSYQILLEWFRNKGYFEINDINIMNHVRDVRNFAAHAPHHYYSGMMGVNHIQVVADLINDTYEDLEIRKVRLRATDQLEDELQRLILSGCQIELMSHGIVVPYMMTVALYDNKRQPNKIHICYKLIFEIPEKNITPNGFEIPPFDSLICNQICSSDNGLLALDSNSEVLFRIVSISDAERLKNWKEWKSRFDLYRSKTLMFDHVDPQEIEQYSATLRTEFHQD